LKYLPSEIKTNVQNFKVLLASDPNDFGLRVTSHEYKNQLNTGYTVLMLSNDEKSASK